MAVEIGDDSNETHFEIDLRGDGVNSRRRRRFRRRRRRFANQGILPPGTASRG
jgi:hypothetical protein